MSDRFRILGVLGRGGTATVHLADDALRGHRVALKVVHPHLADDPAVQRRLRREVQAASLIQHEAALVPYDLHALEQGLALSMPWHPGETLAERVAREGALPPAEVQRLAERLTGALAASHRAGVLHRDVTAANVLLERADDAVLTDFGLARVTKVGTAATTGLLGTAGYAAPEVYEGHRADPRSDLYGLGAVLYLAATGVPPFDPNQPMAALKAQLDGAFVPVAEAAPRLPKGLAALIEALLRPDPADRPAGAAEVAELLAGRIPEGPPPRRRRASAAVRQRLALPEGAWTVLVVERDGDRGRRDLLRRGDGRRDTFEAQITEVGQHIARGIRGFVGLPEQAEAVSPEQALVDAVAHEGGLPEGALRPNRAMLDPRFRLVEATDEPTARRLAQRARDLGFRTEVHALQAPNVVVRTLGSAWWVLMLPMILAIQALPKHLVVYGGVGFLFLMMGLATAASRATVQRRLAGRAIAFRGGREAGPDAAEVPVAAEAPEASEGQRLRQRAEAALDGLDALLADDTDLPEPARRDLRGTSRRLREAAASLGQRHDRLEASLVDRGAAADPVAALSGRLARLATLEAAGRPVDGSERARLEAALAEHEASEAAAEAAESALVATKAQLLEVAATASRVRRELARGEARHSADALVAQLAREADAVERARREAASRRQRQ